MLQEAAIDHEPGGSRGQGVQGRGPRRLGGRRCEHRGVHAPLRMESIDRGSSAPLLAAGADTPRQPPQPPVAVGASLSSLPAADLARLVSFYREQSELLRKDNHYYKAVSRDLKRRIKDEMKLEEASTLGWHDINRAQATSPPASFAPSPSWPVSPPRPCR